MFSEFENYIRKTQTGELRINMNRTNEIENDIREQGLLDKFRPSNFKGSLKDNIKEINTMFDNGFEIDNETFEAYMNDCKRRIKNLTKSEND